MTKKKKLQSKKYNKSTKEQKSSIFGRLGQKVINRIGFKLRLFLVIALPTGIAFLVWLLWGLPLSSQLGTNQAPVSTKIFDRNGELIYEIFGTERRSPIVLSDLPDYIKQATIAIEDKDFYKHQGFSVIGIGRSVERILFEGRVQGGSTITQQLVKNTLLSPERTIRRKAQELLLAVIIEGSHTKDQILELYLNQIPYGGTAYGIEAASENYFGKPARELSLSEATFLAGLPAAPSRYSPFGAHPELARGRQETVLRRMMEDGYISQGDADDALSEELTFTKPEDLEAAHFALWIKEQLAAEYGERTVEQGGLRVTTTLDLGLQKHAQEVVKAEIEKLKDLKVGNGAALATRPGTGEILAMVGSYDYFAEDEDGKVNILFAQRQPGSSIKPLNYALAIQDKKVTPATPIADVPTCFGVLGQPSYCPVNYDGTYHGAVQIRFALGNSLNIPAVRVIALNGVGNFIDFARKLGITTFKDPDNYGLSLTLGGGEVRPADMATAFGVLANGGVKQDLVSILKVEDWKGEVLSEVNIDETKLSGERVMEPEVPFIISHILSDNNARTIAFGPSSFLNVSGHPEASVKTGTTNDRRDNWTIGYTTDALVVSWVGNNDNTPMGAGVSGVSGASPIWNRIIKEALDRAEEGAYGESSGHGRQDQPSGVVGAEVCVDTGNLPSGTPENPDQAGCATRFEYFLKDKVGAQISSGRTAVQIDKTTGILADLKPLEDGGTPHDNIETQDKSFLLDPLGTLICLECPLPEWRSIISYPLPKLPPL